MSERLRGRLTYANVMSTIAVVLAVGGGAAYAANTVFSSDIVNGEVKTQDIATEGVATQDIAPSAVTSGRVENNTLTGADIKEPTLQGVDASTLGGLVPADFLTPVPGKAAATNQDGFSTVECSSGCFTFLGNPSDGANFLDGALKVESCTDGGLMLNYANQSSSMQVIRQVRYSQTGSFVTRSTFAAGAEGNFFLTGESEQRRVEMFVEGGGLGEASYDVYTEHQNSANPEFSDLCIGAGSVTSVYSG
jgi:hypothetical protein